MAAQGDPSKWYVYMVRCADATLYTGVATDVRRRIEEHNGNDILAARYTRGRRPVALVYQESCPDRAAACRREAEIKRMGRSGKLELMARRETGADATDEILS